MRQTTPPLGVHTEEHEIPIGDSHAIRVSGAAVGFGVLGLALAGPVGGLLTAAAVFGFDAALRWLTRGRGSVDRRK
jgi:hypothetical protein